MLSQLSSSTSSTPAPLPLPPQSRKRKRATQTPSASSPAPSDPGNPTTTTTTELLPGRADLSSRPQLSISRGPIFTQTAENSGYFKTDLIGVNRVGFRYVPAGINPPGHIHPCHTIESNPTTFRVSWEDRSPFIKVTKDGLGLAGSTGFRSARCNAPIREGRWYMEVKILHGGGEHLADETRHEGSHVRLGWGRREAPLNGPVGLDGYSYGYRDKTGDKITLSRPRPYGRPFATGDVVGMYISLPPRRQPNKKNDPHDPAHIKRERIAIDLKGQEYFEILEYPQSKEMTTLMDYTGKSTSSASVPSSSKKTATGKIPDRARPANTGKPIDATLRPLPTLPTSRIAFFVNGECQGTAFQDLYDYLPLRQSDTTRKAGGRKRAREGVKEHRENPFDDGSLGYYPFISLFNDAAVVLNPGPDFAFPPPRDIDAVLDGKDPNMSMMVDSADMDVDVDVKPARTWRPACERYPEFMAEQWELDKIEEEEAQAEVARANAQDKAEADKKAERAKKRQQNEARKRAKKTASGAALPVHNTTIHTNITTTNNNSAAPAGSGTVGANLGAADGLTMGPGFGMETQGLIGPGSGSLSHLLSLNVPLSLSSSLGQYQRPSPSPLRYEYELFRGQVKQEEEEEDEEGAEEGAEEEDGQDGHVNARVRAVSRVQKERGGNSDAHTREHSPAPTHASSTVDWHGGQSGYNTGGEGGEEDADADGGHDGVGDLLTGDYEEGEGEDGRADGGKEEEEEDVDPRVKEEEEEDDGDEGGEEDRGESAFAMQVDSPSRAGSSPPPP